MHMNPLGLFFQGTSGLALLTHTLSVSWPHCILHLSYMSHHTYIIHTHDSTQEYSLTHILISLGANTEDEAQHALRRFDIHLPSHMMLPDCRSSRSAHLFVCYQTLFLLYRRMSMLCD